jgi:hypothetical protein
MCKRGFSCNIEDEEARSRMDLVCYLHPGWNPRVRPADPTREWMDASPETFAYRCLPLNIANAHGWEILCAGGFEARWNGGLRPEDVEIRLDPGVDPATAPVALFGQGVLTFHVFGLFRTEPGWNLWIGGSPNRPKDAIFPLTGVVETDWSPFTFTMNWRFTRPDTWVRFEADEPIGFIFPVKRGYLEDAQPRLARLEDSPELVEAFRSWSRSRDAFRIEKHRNPGGKPGDKWQKHYFRGTDADGRTHVDDHATKLRLAGFTPIDGMTMPVAKPEAIPIKPVQACPHASRETAEAGRPDVDRRDAEIERLTAELRTASLDLAKRDWMLRTIERHHNLSPNGFAIERRAGLSTDEFLDRYYMRHLPVILSGEMADWRALAEWTPDYLRARIGDAPVEYQGDRSADPRFEPDKVRHRRQAPFTTFLDLVAIGGDGNDVYITAYNSRSNAAAFQPLRPDLGRLDKFLSVPEDRSDGMLWIGGARTFTPLHHDLTNNFIAQVVGRKRLRLVAPAFTGLLANREHVFSDIVDLDRAPADLLARLDIIDVTLAPGEILFAPIGWWHQVRAIDFSVSLTYTNFLWRNDFHVDYPRAS